MTNLKHISLKLALLGAVVLSVQPQTLAAQTFSNSAKLSDIIVNAYSHHPELRSLRAQLLGTRENIVQANSAFLPQLTLSGGISIEDRDATLTTGADFNQAVEPKEVALRLDQTLFDGGRRRLIRESASLELQVAKARYEESAIAIAAEIIEDYIELLSATADLEILANSVDTLEQLEKSVLVRFDVGDSTKTELAQASSRLASSRADYAVALSEVNFARDQLLSNTGFWVEKPELPLPATVKISQSEQEITDMARALNPAIKASELNEQSTIVNVQSEKRSYIPTVSFSAQAQAVRDSSPTINRNDSVNVGVNFTAPLYAGGAGNSRKRQALAQRNAAKFNTLNIIRQNDLFINQLWSRLESGNIILEARKANVDANVDALEGIKRGEALGISTTQDVLQAIQDKLAAELTYSQAQFNLYTTRLLIKLYTGQFDVHSLD